MDDDPEEALAEHLHFRPAIGRDLNADLATAEWTVSAYVLVIGVFPVAMGRLGDIFGRRRVYLAGLVVFIVASVLCGLSQTIEQLVAARVLQGLGAATMFPGTLAIITSVFPPRFVTIAGSGTASCVCPPSTTSIPLTRDASFRSTSMPLCDSSTTTCAPLARVSSTTFCSSSSRMPKVQSATK